MQTLFTVETDRVRLIWSGPRRVVASRPLEIHSQTGGKVRLDGQDARTLEVAFEEETTYPVLLQSLGGEAVSLEHRDPVVTSGLVTSDGARVVHGSVRFGSQAGRTRLSVVVEGEVVLEVEATVLPTKVTETSVLAMRSDVERIVTGLSLSVLRPATVVGSERAQKTAPPIWLAALHHHLSDLEGAVREIRRRPVLDVVRTVAPSRASQIRRVDSVTRQSAVVKGVRAPALMARPAITTLDTSAHRWLAGRLDRLRRRLRELARSEAARRATERRRHILSDLEGLASRVRKMRSARLFETVGARRVQGVPLVLRRHPVYASAYRALRSLDRGLALCEGDLEVATQDLARLYETWAVLTVVRSLADALEVEPPARPFGADVVGTDVWLRRGRANAVVLERADVCIEVAYEPRFPAPPALLAQRPDLLLTVRRGPKTERVVLDAKYRRDDSPGYRQRYGASGPPEDALGTLHRYRDAIVDGPRIRVAAALFPGDATAAFFDSRLWTSLKDLGVGALPLQPGQTVALDRLSRWLVG